MRRPSPRTVRWMIGLSILVLWEAIPRLGILPELFVPPLTKTLYVLWVDRVIYGIALLVTLREIVLAMLIACGAGILFGAVVGGIASLRALMLPVFSSLYAVPIVILYPVFTAWFGIGPESKIAFAGVYGFFPVMLSTAAGIRTIDDQYLLAARAHGGVVAAAHRQGDHSGVDSNRARGPAAGRRLDDHRRGRLRDADLR